MSKALAILRSICEADTAPELDYKAIAQEIMGECNIQDILASKLQDLGLADNYDAIQGHAARILEECAKLLVPGKTEAVPEAKTYLHLSNQKKWGEYAGEFTKDKAAELAKAHGGEVVPSKSNKDRYHVRKSAK